MDNSGNTSIISDIFRSLSRSIGFNRSKHDEAVNNSFEDIVRRIGDFEFISNKLSVTINFPAEKLELVNGYVRESPNLQKSNKRTGAIYKNND